MGLTDGWWRPLLAPMWPTSLGPDSGLCHSCDLTVTSLPVVQIQQWEQNLEQLHLQLFQLRCYQCSLQGGELPNPKSLLAAASRPSKSLLGRLGVFSVSSFHALVRPSSSSSPTTPIFSLLFVRLLVLPLFSSSSSLFSCSHPNLPPLSLSLLLSFPSSSHSFLLFALLLFPFSHSSPSSSFFSFLLSHLHLFLFTILQHPFFS